MTNHNTDQGPLNEVAQITSQALEIDVIEVVADKGSESRKDILDCVMNVTRRLNPIQADIPINPFNNTLERKDYTASRKVILRIRNDIHKIKERIT